MVDLLDCAIVSDGAPAFVVTSKARARDLKKLPVRLLGSGYGFTHTYIGEHDRIATTGAVQSGREAFRMAGVTPADIDAAELYDCFTTITVIVELEDLGFCPKGEGGRFVEGGRIRLGGELPVTTHGDLLTEPYRQHVRQGTFAPPRCEACGRLHFYPRSICPHCGEDRIAWSPVSGRGQVYSFSGVHRAPSPSFKDDVPT